MKNHKKQCTFKMKLTNLKNNLDKKIFYGIIILEYKSPILYLYSLRKKLFFLKVIFENYR